ncbi:hypothetical protein KIH27_07430 [Mycobacterium sp. M1]|uniref:Uncharacterized protein n=1 Tax=Mycolicibacter acidiphilus TaxID=2835306 RepID=A0ABS5RIX2_9MYCO|nr:hypothetical protein [Mycolicibacter acidiphilus]MBS9533421.1 hypothetical protein [Mycolicibacter acidiphilus]
MSHPDPGNWGHPPFPAPPPQERFSGLPIIRIIAGVIGGGALLLTLMLLWAVITSVLDTNPFADPHGYVIMFGTLIGFICAITATVVLPMALPARRWRRGWAIAVVMLGCWIAVTAACFHYADRHPHLRRGYVESSRPAVGARVTDLREVITGSLHA